MIKRITGTLLTLMFLAFAGFNMNDPDPLPWVLAYGSVAVVCGAAAMGRSDRRVSGGLCIVLAAWMLAMLPGSVDWLAAGAPSITGQMKATEPHIEVMREVLGLLIAVLALLYITATTPGWRPSP